MTWPSIFLQRLEFPASGYRMQDALLGADGQNGATLRAELAGAAFIPPTPRRRWSTWALAALSRLMRYHRIQR
jgi:hypothetical protein